VVAVRLLFFMSMVQGSKFLPCQMSPLKMVSGTVNFVPANQIAGLSPGEMFVHRNVANVVVHSDLNCLSALQFAVDVLRVGHVIVCGHHGCSGVLAALRDEKLGLIDNWLRHVQDVRDKHLVELEALDTEEQRHTRLCELNVIEQVAHVCQTTVVRDAWQRGQVLAVHGWIYGVRDGLLRDLGICVTAVAELLACYAAACAGVAAEPGDAADRGRDAGGSGSPGPHNLPV
jgi:carbonic anhydrase